jgi:lysophospholipase L1-like esterase
MVALVALLVTMSSHTASAQVANDTQHTNTVTRYYLALGDSIAAGASASTTNGYNTPPPDSYVGLVYRRERAKLPGLKLVSYACGGATSFSMINGPNPCETSGEPQMNSAQTFLLNHPNRVALITVDIGFNDIYGCFLPKSIDTSCVSAGLAQVAASLPVILSELKREYPGARIVGMNYYDPLLSYDTIGAPDFATQSLSLFTNLNKTLSHAFHAAGAKMANVFAAYGSGDTQTVVVNGKPEPENLATICQLTEACTSNPHPNDAGHARIAAAFYPLLPKH